MGKLQSDLDWNNFNISIHERQLKATIIKLNLFVQEMNFQTFLVILKHFGLYDPSVQKISDAQTSEKFRSFLDMIGGPHKKLSLLSSNGQKMHICFILHEKKFTENLLHHHVLLFRFVSVFAKKISPYFCHVQIVGG